MGDTLAAYELTDVKQYGLGLEMELRFRRDLKVAFIRRVLQFKDALSSNSKR